jgi:hypothetical protein
MFWQLSSCTLCYLLLVLPGIGLLYALDGASHWTRRMALGNLLGLGAAIILGYYCLMTGVAFRYALIGEYAALVVVVAVFRHRVLKQSQPVSPAPKNRFPALYIGLLVLAVFVSRAIPTFFNEVPLGVTDPCFHCLIAEKIALTHRIPVDWKPFESMKLNYPIGAHVLLAQVAGMTRLPVHVVFKMLFPVLASFAALAMFSLGLTLAGDFAGAFFSAVAYSFLAIWGSLHYYWWGGLPNLIGMLFFLGLVDLVINGQSRSSVALFGVLFAAQIYTHHHSALCAAAVLAGYVLFSWAITRRLSAVSKGIVTGSAVALALSAVPLAHHFAVSLGEVGKTSVFKFYEPLLGIWQAAIHLGIPLVILGVLGIFLLFREARSEPQLFLLFWTVSLFGLFVIFEYGYRFAAYLMSGGFYTALTPSRFLTNLAYPLSIAAGLSLAKLQRKFRPSLAAPVIVLGALVWAFFPVRGQTARFPRDIAAYKWIGEHAEQNALVVSSDTWAAYFSQRETTWTPLPASETRNDEYVRYKRDVLTKDWDEVVAFRKKTLRPVYVAFPVETGSIPGATEVFHGKQIGIYKLW